MIMAVQAIHFVRPRPFSTLNKGLIVKTVHIGLAKEAKPGGIDREIFEKSR